MRTSPGRRRPARLCGRLVLVRPVALVTALILLVIFSPAGTATAYEYGTGGSATTLTSPSGLTMTAASSGFTTLSGATTLGVQGYRDSDFQPDLATGSPALQVDTEGTGCPATVNVSCTGRGTLTLSFNQPVLNPVLHVAGLGVVNNSAVFHAQLTPQTGTVSLVSGANLAVVSNTVTALNHIASPNCLDTTGAASVAGCGSFRVNGLVTSVTFTMSVIVGATSGGTAPSTFDRFVLAFSADQDYGDAPATFDATEAGATVAASHIIGDLKLGAATTTIENANVANSTVAPQPSSTAGADGADDGTTAFANQIVGVGSYSKTVTLSGVSKAATLCGWIDYNQTGIFSDTVAERVCIPIAVGQTSATLSWPATDFPTSAGLSYARLRVAYGSGNLLAKGALASGEVEDYPITFVALAPALTLAKSANRTSTDTVGQVTTYSFLVRNTGNVTINNVTVADPKIGLSEITCTPANGTFTLAPGETKTCTATRATTQADLSAGGNISNTAVVTGTPVSGVLTPATSTANVAVTQTPALTFTKTGSPNAFPGAGQTISYTFRATNSGNVALAGVQIADPKPGLSALSCTQPVTLQPGASLVCTATYVTTQADVNAGVTANTATATSTTGNLSKTATVAIPGPARAPAVDLTKTPSSTTFTAVGETITYTFTAKNAGNVTLTGVGIADPAAGLSALTCAPTPQPAALAPGASLICTATRTTTQADLNAGSVSNTATATGTAPAGVTPATVTDSDTATVTGPTRTPAIDLVKSATPASVSTVGQVVTYTFTVKNTGNVTLRNVVVEDPKAGLSPITCTPAQPFSLAPGITVSCTATRATTQADLNAATATVNNTATATGNSPTGVAPASVSDSDTASVAVDATPNLTLVKSASPSTFTTPGQTITYTFTAKNTGNVGLSAMSITDQLPGLSALSCIPTQPATRAPGESLVCTATRVTTQADLDAGVSNNTATVTATPPNGTPFSRAASARVTGIQTRTIDLTKSAAPTTITAAGQSVIYTFTAKNTGNTTLTKVAITDPLAGLPPLRCVPPSPTTLAPNATLTCTATYTATQADVDRGRLTNTATATGQPPTGPNVTATASVTVTALANPQLVLDKSVAPDTITRAGEPVTYTFVATNTGNVTLAKVAITDGQVGLSALSCTPAQPLTLAPNNSMTCTATYAATQADIDFGAIQNTATVTGTPPSGPALKATDSANVTVIDASALVLEKTADPVVIARAGEQVTYTFVATNTGNTTLSGVEISDPLKGLSALTCRPSPLVTLAPKDALTCRATYTATQADVNAGSIINIATASASTPRESTVRDTDDAIVTATASPGIALAKSASPTKVSAAGDEVTYTFVATNTGNIDLSKVTIADAHPGLSPLSCTPAAPATLAPDDDITCTATYIVTQADVDAGTIDNTATATGSPPRGPAVSDRDTATLIVPADPSVKIVKQANPTAVEAAGDPVVYTFLATNTGNVTLTDVSITDPHPGLSPLSCTPTQPATLAPQADLTCTATYQATQADVDRGGIENTATVTGTPPTGPVVADQDSATVSAPSNPSISIAKTVDPTTVTRAGDQMSYTFVATNTGNVTLTDVNITDPLAGISSLACDPAQPATLAPEAQLSCTATYPATQADVDAGRIDNTATVSGTPPTGRDVSADDSATVTIGQSPAIAIVKEANPASVGSAGDQIIYTVVATNTGNVTLTGVQITDSLVGAAALKCRPTQPATLGPAEQFSCQATYTATQADMDAGQILNTATVVGTSPTGTDVRDSDDATVDIPAGPSISIGKGVDPQTVSAAGDKVTYTFVVTNTGNVSLDEVGITDPLPGLSELDCAPARPATLAPGAQLRCTATYTATQTDIDAGSLANTATAAGTSPTGDPVYDTDDAEVTVDQHASLDLLKTADPMTVNAAGDVVTYTFVATNTGNVTLAGATITDPLPGLSALDCDPAQPATLAPGAVLTCTATKVLTQDDVNTGQVRNTATVSATPPTGPPVSSDSTVVVRVPARANISLVKDADPTSVGSAGDPVRFTFTATNTGNVSLSGVRIVDLHPGLSDLRCDATVPATLGSGESFTCTATYTATQDDVDAGAIRNTAVVTGVPPTGTPVTDSDDAIVTIGAGPAIELTKTGGTGRGTVGEKITYTFVATNTGNVRLADVRITDPMPGLSALRCAPAQPVTLAPGQRLACTASYPLTQADVDRGEVVNTAMVTGTPPGDQPAVTDQDTSVVSLEQHPSFGFTKTAEAGQVSVGDAVSYTLLATNTGDVTLSDVTVVDSMDGLSALTCTPGQPAVLAPHEVLTCRATYLTTSADAARGQVVNTATVRGEAPGGNPSDAEDDLTGTGVAAVTVTAPALPNTGGPPAAWLGLTALLTLLGGAGIVVGRRRQH